MTIATFMPYLRREYDFGPADESGSLIAHMVLMEHALREPIVDQAIILPEQYPFFVGPNTVRGSSLDPIRDLQRKYPNRVRPASIEWLANNHSKQDLLFLAKLSDISGILALRRAVRGSFPICCVTHAVLHPNLAANYLATILQAEECDSIVVTSAAAEYAVRELLRQAASIVEEAVPGGNAAFRSPEICAIPLPADEALLSPPDRRHARAMLRVDDSDVVFLYVGRFSEQYKADLEPLIIAFREVLQKQPQARLLLAGHATPPSYLDTLESLISGWHLGQRVRLLNRFPHFLKPHIYAAGDVFVSPVDNVQETFGLSVVDAMAAGLPSIVSDWSGYRDLIQDGVTGFTIPTYLDTSAFSTASCLAACSATPHTEYFLASRTVVDVSRLTSQMLRLAASSELRLSLGQAARAVMLAKYAPSAVLGKYVSLWGRQISSGHIGRGRNRQGFVDVREVFRTHPSKTLDDPGLVLKCDRSSLNSAEVLFQAADPRLGLMRECCSRLVPLREVLKHAPASTKQMVLSLIKKGFLTLGTEADGEVSKLNTEGASKGTRTRT